MYQPRPAKFKCNQMENPEDAITKEAEQTGSKQRPKRKRMSFRLKPEKIPEQGVSTATLKGQWKGL